MADESREGQVSLGNVRLSFAHIFRAQEGRPDPVTGLKGAPKFNCAFLIDKNSDEGKKNLERLKKVMREIGNKKWGENPATGPKKWQLKPEKLCLRDGDLETFDGYAGMMYVSASNTRKPKLLDRRRGEVSEESGMLYSGCYVNAIVRIWAQDNEHGKRINASLEGIQYVRNGEAFGAAPLSDDAFGDLGDDETEGDALSGSAGTEEEDDGIL